ncbi:MAG: hypothetical protein ACXAC2_00045 [Candidatus Kariarchaeaceae archaeon]|jgi:hypothetical protein
MSSEEERFGYGIDIEAKINVDGEVDIVVAQDGDIALIGGDGSNPYLVRADNAKQQIRLRLITPLNSLLDENGNPLPLGSVLLESIGSKMTENVLLYLKSVVSAAIFDLPFLESINAVNFIIDRKQNPTKLGIEIGFTLKEDNEVYFTTIQVVE